MGAQEKTEEVLRSIHTLFSKAQPFDNTGKKVIVDKTVLMDLLKELNTCMYEMQEEYELTEQSRDKASRKTKKEGEDMIFEAQKRADDIYAGAILYTDNALHEIQDIVQETNDQVYVLMERMRDKLRNAKENVRTNQTELRSQLTNLIDTQKYMRLIEEENLRRAKEEAKKAEKLEKKSSGKKGMKPVLDPDPFDEEEEPKVAAVMPEIRINTEFLAAHGMSLGDEEEELTPKNAAEEELPQDGLTAEERLSGLSSDDLDSEYFSWKEGEEEPEDLDGKAESIMAGVIEDMKDQFKEIFKK